jgi:hypothetical protein
MTNKTMPNFPVSIFLQKTPVPEWLAKVEVIYTHRSLGTPEIIFGSPVLCIRYKNRFFIWAPFTKHFLKCFVKIDGKQNQIKVAGNWGVVDLHLSICSMYRSIRNA